MKMILSSCDFRNDKSNKAIMDNLPKSIDKCKLLFIPNEKATYEQIHSDKFVLRMQEFGFIKENITIFDYYNPEQYKHLDIDVLYISGGNTLKTLQRIRNANFDKDIINYINNGVTYIGGSAGAHIVTKDVSHVSIYDEVPDDMKDFSGLGLFDGILICHYKQEREEHKIQLESGGKYKVYTLTDDEFIVYNNNIVVKLTQESEVEELCNIQKAAFQPLYEKYHDECNPCLRGTEDISNRLNSDYFRYFTIYLNNEIVGGILYKCKGRTPFIDSLKEGQYYLQRVYIKSEYQSKRIAQKAILLSEKYLLDATSFLVDFPEDLIKNRRCYEKAGYVDTGKRMKVQDNLVLACFEKKK